MFEYRPSTWRVHHVPAKKTGVLSVENEATGDGIQAILDLYNENSPFTEFLGIRGTAFDSENAVLTFEKQEAWIGNYHLGSLHGGVVAGMLDAAGAILVLTEQYSRGQIHSFEKQKEKASRISTIDLHIDYLKPGTGKAFYAAGEVLRIGNRVAVARVDLNNEAGQRIAVATGTYSIG